MIFFLILKLYRFFFKSQADVIIKLFILIIYFILKVMLNLIYYFIYIRSILLFSVHFHKKNCCFDFYFFSYYKNISFLPKMMYKIHFTIFYVI